MRSRAVRLAVLILFAMALGVAAYLFRASGVAAEEQLQAERQFTDRAQLASRSALDLRAAQAAYVAAGQEGEFWTSRVTQTMTALRDALTALRADASTPDAQTQVDAAISSLQDFSRMDVRARDYVHSGQKLLASDLIFTNGLELTDTILGAVEKARTAEALRQQTEAGTFERRQRFALTAAAAAALLVTLLLLPRVEADTVPGLMLERAAPPMRPTLVAKSEPIGVVSSESDGWTPARRASDIQPAEPVAASVVAAPSEDPVNVSDQGPPTPVPAPAPPPEPAIDLPGVAELCTELSRVDDTLALPPLLDRAAALLDASGIILWIAAPDGRELMPILAQGYSAQLVARLGPLARDARNATAAAFRTSVLQTVKAGKTSSGAIAAPLVTPSGCVGVMAAEIRHEGETQDAKLAAATILAAQLACLVGPPTPRQPNVEAAGA
jgi:GAF domain-containing protein